MEQKFFVCKHCGNLVGMIHSSGVPMICCGEAMTPLVASHTDGAVEKHLPVATVDGNHLVIKVGSVDHPMTENHYIMWVYAQTERGGMRHTFEPSDEPECVFCNKRDKVVAVYAYCNLHGLWRIEL